MLKLKYAVLALVLSGCAAQVLSAGERTVVIKARSNDDAGAIALPRQNATNADFMHGFPSRLRPSNMYLTA